MNKVIMIGRLTKDPEVKKTSSGKTVASFSLAVSDRYNRDKTDFINCVAWEKTADYLGNYVKKGNLIAVEGRISTRNYDGSDGKKVYITEVVCESVQGLERNDQTQTPSNPEQPRATPSNPKPWQTFTPEPTEEDLPF
jgi:single-strand DNA-binding protein